jgi:hypothetical protein
MMSQVEVAALIVSAVLAVGIVWVPAVCLFRRAVRRWAYRRPERADASLLDVIGRR